MGIEQLDINWKDTMFSMGYSPNQIIFAEKAGASSVPQAVEFISRSSQNQVTLSDIAQPPKSSHEGDYVMDVEAATPEPLDTSQAWPALSDSVPNDPSDLYQPIKPSAPILSSESQQYPQPQFGGLANARNSLDRIEIDRNAPVPVVTAEELPTQSRDDLRVAIEISSREQHSRDMARAIAASKEQATLAPGNDDQDVMRAIQESLKTSQQNSADRTVSWQSNAYISRRPTLRTSLEDPVGLRNIGNTCYLNSLLQVYYYLPAFRRAILKYRSPLEGNVADDDSKSHAAAEKDSDKMTEAVVPIATEDIGNDALSNHTEQPNAKTSPDKNDDRDSFAKKNAVRFVVELQRLFAAMALGNQSCVDPTDVTRAMRNSDGEPIVIGTQQDAFEFNQILLDIVEKGLGQDISQARNSSAEPAAPTSSSAPGQQESLVKDLFTVRFRQEIRRCSAKFPHEDHTESKPMTTNCETTAIIVNATSKQERDLHSGLDDYTLTRIEPSDDGSSSPEKKVDVSAPSSERQTAVQKEEESPISLALDRGTCTDTSSCGIATKSVWFTKLPPVFVIYLQRVSYNRSTLQADKIHDQYDFPLEIAFDRYMAENRVEATRAKDRIQAIKAEKKRLHLLLAQYHKFPLTMLHNTNGDTASTNEYRPSKQGFQDGYFSAASRIQKRLRDALDPSSPLFKVDGISPENIETSLDTIGRILDHDRGRCEGHKRELISIEPETKIYKSLSNVKYKLHAVLVHDGAPESGHYWAFIRDWGCLDPKKMWKKLSDSTVSFVTEEEMYTRSAGGSGRASAYCLIYTTSSQTDESAQKIYEESKELLPRKRLEEVAHVSSEFEQEEQDCNLQQPNV